MLQSYRTALEFVSFSPENQRDNHHARALRGEGFALIELNQLDEAEKSFQASLKVEPDNKLALSELDYIKKLRQQKQ